MDFSKSFCPMCNRPAGAHTRKELVDCRDKADANVNAYQYFVDRFQELADAVRLPGIPGDDQDDDVLVVPNVVTVKDWENTRGPL